MNKSQATQLPIHITTPPCKELVTLLPIAIESSSNLLRKIKPKGLKNSKELISTMNKRFHQKLKKFQN
jgi:hypothetical protein